MNMIDFNTKYRKDRWCGIYNINGGSMVGINARNLDTAERNDNKIIEVKIDDQFERNDAKIELDARQALFLINRLKTLVRNVYPGAINGTNITHEDWFDDNGNPISEEYKQKLEYNPYN